MTRATSIPKATCLRLSFYLRELERAASQGRTTISSAQLAGSLATTAAQVRKDFSLFGQFGRPGVGYDIEELCRTIRAILGVDRRWPVAVVGVGNLGRALARHAGFAQRNFNVVALFDIDPAKVGTSVAGVTVSPMEDMAGVLAERGVKLALLTGPADAAQQAAQALVKAGVAGILNFAPMPIRVPGSVVVHPVELTVMLEQLSCEVSVRRSEGSPEAAGPKGSLTQSPDDLC